MIHPSRLFVTSCLSMLVTSMIFSVRADILGPVSGEYLLSNEMIGLTMSSVFWGFTLGIIVCATLVDLVGMKRLHVLSGIGYIAGILLILTAPANTSGTAITGIFSSPSTTLLYLGFLLTGISQGVVEGVTNPLVATLHRDDKRRMFNRLHAWWPAGLIVGGVVAWGLGLFDLSWRVKLAVVILPALAYLVLSATQSYPQTERVTARVSSAEMYRQIFQPLFLLLFVLMWFTAATELGPDQWFSKIMADLVPALGENAILFLAYTAGIMFLLRQFASTALRGVSPYAVLSGSALLSMVGLWILGSIDGANPSAALLALLGATVFGIGKTFFWPTMLAVTSEQFPRGGALLVNLMGGAGMLSVMISLPLIGRVIDQHDAATALRYMAALPAGLTLIFALLWLRQTTTGGYRPQTLETDRTSP